VVQTTGRPATVDGGTTIFNEKWEHVLKDRLQNLIVDPVQARYIRDMNDLIAKEQFDIKTRRLHVCENVSELYELIKKNCKVDSDGFGATILQLGDTFISCIVNEFANESYCTCDCLFPTLLFASFRSPPFPV
jgi:hypothetical protein